MSLYHLWQDMYRRSKPRIRMTTLRDALCKEIESRRIDDDTPSMETRCRSGTSSLSHYQSRHRTNTYSESRGHTQLKNHSSQSTRGRSHSLPLELIVNSRDFFDGGQSKVETKVLMTGWLHKTTRLKSPKTRGHRQHRKFKLTAHSLEYSNLLQKVQL